MDQTVLNIIIAAAIIYIAALVIIYVAKKKNWKHSDKIRLIGPIIVIETDKVEWFDKFAWIGRHLGIVYGIMGILFVAIMIFFGINALFGGLNVLMTTKPTPTGLLAPQNALAIPGLNEYIPASIAVVIAFFLTLFVHEFGHAIVSRAEDIKLKTWGILVIVFPIGAFVEPDPDELNNAPIWSQIKVYSAGISHNMIFGILCFAAMFYLVSPVLTFNSVADMMSVLILPVVPNNLHQLYITELPTYIPFYGFWTVIHSLFWTGWLCINIALFNALPMVPLDGGYIFRNVLNHMFKGRESLIKTVTFAISVFIVAVIIGTYAIPWLL